MIGLSSLQESTLGTMIYWALQYQALLAGRWWWILTPVIAVMALFITLFLLPIEIERMYKRDGRKSPVSAVTAFWILLFIIPWYVKCQAALNDYWEAKGAPAP